MNEDVGDSNVTCCVQNGQSLIPGSSGAVDLPVSSARNTRGLFPESKAYHSLLLRFGVPGALPSYPFLVYCIGMVFRRKDKCAFVFVLRAGKVDALARANIRLCDNRSQHSLFLPLFT
jgi:hypothetical protein